jgi:LytS/YehU family sensor histidine kinase
MQFVLSVIIIRLLIPVFLNKKKKILFGISILIAVYLVQVLYHVGRAYYFEPYFQAAYNVPPPMYSFWENTVSLFAYIKNITWLTFPSIILISVKYYSDQKDIIALKEQKKTTELNLLKHQLNPHFLFNTLNNLYALALKKSDKTPEVIAKLSEILDYILYQCKDNYVPLGKEIELLENYIGLEKVRYGDRVEVIFDKDVHDNLKIAPLILLTFVENAFKHGISQELQKGNIHISISAKEDIIVFKSSNTKPSTSISSEETDKKSIGMNNIIKQLDLLYPNAYDLKINESNSNYNLRLELYEKV